MQFQAPLSKTAHSIKGILNTDQRVASEQTLHKCLLPIL